MLCCMSYLSDFNLLQPGKVVPGGQCDPHKLEPGREEAGRERVGTCLRPHMAELELVLRSSKRAPSQPCPRISRVKVRVRHQSWNGPHRSFLMTLSHMDEETEAQRRQWVSPGFHSKLF